MIQCESRQNRNKKFVGFQAADEQILKIICFYLQMRLERRHALKEVRRREQQVVDTLRLTSEICTQRHHEGLFRKLKETLPGFFGFQAVGVLMHNKQENFFFSDPDAGPETDKKDDDGDTEETNSMKQGEGKEKKKKQAHHEQVIPI